MIRRGLKLRSNQDQFCIAVAKTRDELEGAFRILHDSYVAHRLMKPDPSGLRCNLYQAVPGTTILITKFQEQIVGTLSVIPDSRLGFPSDGPFQKENDHFRQLGHKICELSGFAVHSDYRNQFGIALRLMTWAYLYATDYLSASALCATIDPRLLDYYSALFRFEKYGKEIRYAFTDGAPTVLIIMQCAGMEQWLQAKYAHLPGERNLHQYVKEQRHRMRLACGSPEARPRPIITPELFEYFFAERTNVLSSAKTSDILELKAAYERGAEFRRGHDPVAEAPIS